MKVRPLHDRVLVLPEEMRKKTESGIIIPDTVTERPKRGEVIAVGPGYADQPTTIQKADQILFATNAGTEITIGDEKLLLMRESDVVGVIESEDDEIDIKDSE